MSQFDKVTVLQASVSSYLADAFKTACKARGVAPSDQLRAWVVEFTESVSGAAIKLPPLKLRGLAASIVRHVNGVFTVADACRAMGTTQAAFRYSLGILLRKGAVETAGFVQVGGRVMQGYILTPAGGLWRIEDAETMKAEVKKALPSRQRDEAKLFLNQKCGQSLDEAEKTLTDLELLAHMCDMKPDYSPNGPLRENLPGYLENSPEIT